MSYRDIVAGRTRTWPYGTRKTVKVEEVILGQAVIGVEESTREGWVILGVDLTGVEVGQEREIVFCKGGPTGGYWDFLLPEPPPERSLLDLGSQAEDVRTAVDAAVRGYEPVDADGREILSRRVFFERGGWMARYGLDDHGEPELLYQVVQGEPGTGIGDYNLDLRRVHR